MKLQVALDLVDKKKALAICKKIKDHIDIIEFGTPFIKSQGLGIIKDFKRFKKPLLADLKTMDTGAFEAGLAFKAGASIATVCGTADNETIKGAIKAARANRKKVLVDLIAVKNVVKRAKEVLKWGANYVCIHTGIDAQHKGKTPMHDLAKLSKKVKKEKIAVAGGISLKTIDKIAKYRPGIVIVGSAITKAKNPESIARTMKGRLR